jgi:hypothetical protein
LIPSPTLPAHFWTAPETYLPTFAGASFMLGPTTYVGAGVPSGNVSRVTTFRLDLPLFTASFMLGGQGKSQALPAQPKPPRRLETRVPTAA